MAITRPAKPSKVAKTPPKPPTAEILGKADGVTLVAKADKDGRIRLNCSSWEDYRVVLPGQVLELRWQAGQVVLVKLPARTQ
jgi:hypothetical protein